MMAQPFPRLWNLLEEALGRDGARTLHLTVGAVPLLRQGDADLQPLREDLPRLTMRAMQVLLSYAVDPDQWERLEAMGEGEVRLANGSGRPLRMTVFRSAGAWSAVVHL